MNNRQMLQEIAAIFLAEELDQVTLSATAKRYRELLFAWAEFDSKNEDFKTDIYIENGKAIGSYWAAACISDARRTRKLIKGVFEAIKYLKTKNEGPVHILYAGTGPFAALILPLLAVYTEEEVQVTLIEINENSCDFLKKIFSKLNFNGFVKALVQEDATAYKIKDGEQIDVLLSETMQHALREEPQVSIVTNLLKQMTNEVILIPARIILYLGFLNTEYPPGQVDDDLVFKKEGAVFELSKETIKDFKYISADNQGEIDFVPVTMVVKPASWKHYTHLAIFTEIQVFGTIWLRTYESGLTSPWIIAPLPTEETKEWSLTLRYQIAANPGLAYKLG
ncbi:MAG: hypothetical protein C7N36_03860 [Bacteroidetes bacterium]|nr:MAG: hypothetical protein C7N36_03860 [Bacteroidota bacterium]